MTHRRGAAGARRDEADLDRAARAATRSTSRTGEAAKAHQPALGRVRGAGGRHRRRGDGRAGARRRGAGEVRRRLGRRDPRATCDVLPRRTCVGAADGAAWSCSSGRPAPARPRSGGCSPSASGVAVPRHRRRRRGARPGRPSPTSSSTRARRTSARWSATRSRARWPSTTGVLALGGGAVLDDGTRAAAGRPHGGLPATSDVKDAASRVGLNRDRPLLLGNPRAQWLRLMEARRPLYEEVAVATVPHRRPHARRGRRRRRARGARPRRRRAMTGA